MKSTLKFLLYAVIGLVAVLLIGGLLLPRSFTVVRSIAVDAPPARIYALLVDPQRWPDWTVWNQRDPAMAISYSGPASGVGAVWAWKSQAEGDGRMTFTAVEPDRRLAYDLYFPDWDSTSSGDLTLQADGARTTVRWTMVGSMGANPLWRWMGLFADGMVGKDFDAGLARLKALAEKP